MIDKVMDGWWQILNGFLSPIREKKIFNEKQPTCILDSFNRNRMKEPFAVTSSHTWLNFLQQPSSIGPISSIIHTLDIL